MCFFCAPCLAMLRLDSLEAVGATTDLGGPAAPIEAATDNTQAALVVTSTLLAIYSAAATMFALRWRPNHHQQQQGGGAAGGSRGDQV